MPPMQPDQIIDRRRLKRRLTLWRVLALVAFGAVIWVALPADTTGTDHVARLDIRGTITEDRRLLDAIERLATDSTVRAVIVAIDSPGGTVAGGEAIHAALTRVAAARPVVATMGATAASAGYMVALPAARIFARESTLTGSIGVILQTFEASELLARLGVRPESITSGPLKDQPSPFRPLTEEGRASLNQVVQDMYGQFVRMVAAGRRMSEEAVRAVADGRVLSGARARGGRAGRCHGRRAGGPRLAGREPRHPAQPARPCGRDPGAAGPAAGDGHRKPGPRAGFRVVRPARPWCSALTRR